MLDSKQTRVADIEGYPGYTIDEFGVILNSDEKELKWSYTQQGAPKVGLYGEDGRRRTLSVKVLVADAFLEPHPEEHYDTAICLDGDQSNCHVSNLVWRPRFFANLYSRQFEHDYAYYHKDRIYDTDTGEVYESIYNAAVKNGILLKDVLTSVHNNQPVRCTLQRFAFYHGV